MDSSSSFHATVFYDPALPYYVSRGWDEKDLLSGRMQTVSTIRGPMVLPFPSSLAGERGEEEVEKQTPRLSLRELKREAMRALLFAYTGNLGGCERAQQVQVPKEKREGGLCQSAEEGHEHAEDEEEEWVRHIEAGVHRWADLIHIKYGATYLVDRDEGDASEGGPEKPTEVRSPASVQHNNCLWITGAKVEAADKRSQHSQTRRQESTSCQEPHPRPVVLPSSVHKTVLVVSFRRAEEWRAQRRERLLQEREAKDGQAEGETQDDTVFLCEDDKSFARWLSVKEAKALLAWRRRYCREHRDSPIGRAFSPWWTTYPRRTLEREHRSSRERGPTSLHRGAPREAKTSAVLPVGVDDDAARVGDSRGGVALDGGRSSRLSSVSSSSSSSSSSRWSPTDGGKVADGKTDAAPSPPQRTQRGHRDDDDEAEGRRRRILAAVAARQRNKNPS